LHQGQQAPGPEQQAADQRRRQAEADLRRALAGLDVRDDQAREQPPEELTRRTPGDMTGGEVQAASPPSLWSMPTWLASLLVDRRRAALAAAALAAAAYLNAIPLGFA